MTETVRRRGPGSLGKAAEWTIGIAVVLAVGAMIRYPGGTALDPATHRYSLSRNFLSDLGMTVAYNHQSNRLGAGLFVLSLLLLVIGLGHTILGIAGRLAVQPAARRWARAAGLGGFLCGVAFVGVAMTPQNQAMTAHIAFTLWGWRIVPIIAGLLAVASFRSLSVPRRVTMAWLLVMLGVAAYAALLTWGPSVTTVDGLVIQAIAQKIATALVLVALLFVSRAVDRIPLSTRRLR